MKISANWLSDYVDHALSVDELADRLTMAGLEVEEIEEIGVQLDGVVVAHVLDVKRHPNADRLTVCSVDIGQTEPVSIVCGAPNVAADQKVPVATVGSTLSLPGPGDPESRTNVKIKKSKIRGEVSLGMICAADELGLSDDHSGIMVLSDDAEIGMPMAEYLSAQGVPLSDTAIDIAITPNRPDAVCHLGVARDVAALENVQLVEPQVSLPKQGGEAVKAFSVTIEAEAGCPRYVGILVRDVTVQDSPVWMQHRLKTIGLRPRNNVVDITNYVMHELGQPLHAFDFEELAGPKIIVRETTEKTNFRALDDKQRELPVGTLMIADAERDVAIAGVMGGRNSEVTADTQHVLIESAYFNPSQIRQTAKALQIQTDASYRFERGVDPTGQARAAARAAELMVEYAGGTIVDGMVDANPIPYEPRIEALRPARVEHVLGLRVPVDQIHSLLCGIGFRIEDTESGNLNCEIPPFRPDIEREVDIIEEVARLVGYDRIPEPTRSLVPNHPVFVSPQRSFREKTGDLLVGMGYREIITNSMLSREVAETFRDEILPGARFGGDVVDTLNPVSREMATLRPSLLPGALRVAGHNVNRGQTSLRYYEFGNTQMRIHTEHSILPNYTERECLLILSAGDHSAAGWDSTSRIEDIFDLKGIVESVLASIKLPDVKFEPVYDASKVSTHHIDVFSGDKRLGVCGKVKDDIAKTFDLRGDTYFFELDWTSASELAAPFLRKRYESFSRHPQIDRDIAVTVARAEAVGPMLSTIQEEGGEFLKNVRVFDLYDGDQIETSLKSVAFAMTFRSDRTLRDEEVDADVAKIISALEKNHGANLRQ